MKKLGILIFIIAAIGGIILAKMFNFGAIPAVEMPNISLFSKVKGSGSVITQKRDLSGFTGVDFGGVFNVEINAGDEYAVEVEADDNLLQYITTRVDGETLKIGTEERINTKNRIKIRISAPNIEMIEASGASRAVVNNVKNEKLVIDTGGASGVTVSGSTTTLVIDMGGASYVDASGLSASKVTVDGGGASRAKVNAGESLSVDLGGASRVSYTGTPTELKKSTSGASSVRQSE